MTQELTVYDIFQGWPVRKVDRGDGKVWRVFADCCKALGFKNSRQVLNRISKLHVLLMDTSAKDGFKRKLWVINEEGLISLIAYSRLPKEQLDAFRELIGRRAVAPPTTDPWLAIQMMSKGLMDLDERVRNLEQRQIAASAATLPVVPEIPLRKQIVRLVRDYVYIHPHDFESYEAAYVYLYTEFKYRYGVDIMLCARNREIRTIDYIESIGKQSDLLALAHKLFGDKA